MPNISFGEMSLDSKRQPAGSTRHKCKVEFRLAASLSAFLPHTQISWESWWHLPTLHVPQHVLGGAGTGQHTSPSSKLSPHLEFTHSEAVPLSSRCISAGKFCIQVCASFLPRLQWCGNCHSTGTGDSTAWFACHVTEIILSPQENRNPNSSFFSGVNKSDPQIYLTATSS